MRAVWYERLGAAHDVLQIGDTLDPEPGPGEVRARIAFSGVNPSDVKRRAGSGSRPGPMPFPRMIPNQDGAGVIDRVGPGVDPARIGERVWLHSTCWGRPFGTAAQFAVTPAHRAIRLADHTSFAAGASLGVPAMTAHRAVFGPGPVTGKTVLVTGGAGAVGFYAIQLAKWAGARVIATVSGAEKAKLAESAGADAIVNYKTEDVVGRVLALTGTRGVDHIAEVDFGANIEATLRYLRAGGSVATYASMAAPEPKLPFYPFMQRNITLLWVAVYDMPRAAIDQATADTNAWLASGRAVMAPLHPFEFDRFVDAHLAVERGAVGKVVVEIGGEQLASGRGAS